MSLDNPAIWLFAAIVVPCAFLAIKYWQGALFGVFVLAVFEGALRKWAFPWAQAQIYLIKDAILLAIYLGFILDGRRNLPAPTGTGLIKLVLLLCFVWGCIELLNPNSPSILVGLVGLKAYFLYAPIAFILPYAIKSREHLFVLIRRYLIMAIPVAVLGFIQIIAGPGSSLNVYVSQSEDSPDMVAYFGHDEDLFVRTSGTFSYISGYTAFLGFVVFLAIGYNMAYGWRIKKNITPILALSLLIGAMFTTGSRAPVFYLLATSPVMLWLAVTRRVLSRQAAMRLCIVLPIVTILALSASPRALQAFVERAQEASDRGETITRLYSPLYQTIGALSEGPALGTGIGTTHGAALSIMGAQFPWWLPIVVEDEMARVTLEQGFIGLLLNYFLRFLIVVVALRWVRSFKDPAYRALGIVLVVWLPQGLITSIMLNVTMALYYWGALGIMLAMRRLEQSAGAEFGEVLVRGVDQTTNLQPVMPMVGAARRRPS
jgi:hypothetical protein